MNVTVRKPTPQEIAQAEMWPIWTKEPSTFDWTYDTQETFYVLEGEVDVTLTNGEVLSFSQGDWVTFAQGVSCTWQIKKAIRKHYYFG